MTTLAEALDRAVETVRGVKEQRVARGGTDVDSCLAVYRGDDLAALIFPELPQNRDAMLWCARMAAGGFCADVIALTMETWYASAGRTTNPLTGKQWGPGEMQDAADNHDGVAKGWIADALMVQVYNRAGDTAQITMPYSIKKRRVLWGEPVRDEGVDHAGYVYEFMIGIMKEETIDHAVHSVGVDPQRDLGLDIEQARAHADCAVAKVMLGLGPFLMPFRAHVVMSMKVGTERARIITDSMPQ